VWFAAFVIVVVVMIAWFAFEAHRKARAEKEAAAINAGKIKLKTIVADGPFRSNAAGVYEEPASRAAEPATLEAVQAALRTAGLTLRPIHAKKPKPGFEIEGPKGFLRITVADPARVEPSTMMIAYTEAELVVDGAVALVPLFGPIGIDMGDAAWLVVDGSRDVAAIRKELSDRYLAMMKQMMEAMAPLQEMLDQIGKAVERKRT
jgi:hypothetical protein